MKSTNKTRMVRCPNPGPVAIAVASGLFSIAANAQSTQTATLPTVTVTGDRTTDYLSTSASSATKVDIAIKETPASISVIDESLIQDKAIRRPGDLADVVSSVQQVVGYGNSPSQMFIIRGFSNGSVNYRDGYRSYDPYAQRDLANVERVEFVKGPSSVLYGNAPPAGAVNTITKTPQPSDFNFIDYSLGSWSANRVTGDFNKAYDQFQIRLNVAADTSDSYIDYERSRSSLFAPSIRLKLSRDTEVLYAFEWYKSRTDGLSNGLPMSPETFNLGVDATVGQSWAYQNFESNAHRIELNTQLNEQWKFRQGLSASKTKRDYKGVSPDGSFTDTLAAAYVNYNGGPVDDTTNNSIQSEFIGDLTLGPAKHKVLLGFEKVLSKFKYGFYDDAFGCFNDPQTNCVSFASGLTSELSSSFAGTTYFSQAETNAIYASDHITYGNWRWLVGLRSEDTKTSNESTSLSRNATTGRLGVMYFVAPNTATYYSWGQSFVPNLGSTSSGSTLAPEEGSQHELGVKHTIQPGLEATLSAFEITKKNVRRSDPDDDRYYVTDGEQRSSGYEVSVMGRVSKQAKVVANYSYLAKAKVISGDSAGNRLYGTAREMWNVWGHYSLSTSLPGASSFGLGVVNVGDRYADASNSVTLPGYTRFDAGVYYKLRSVNYALNLKNISNAKIWDSVEGSYIHRQAPRSIMLTAGMQF